MSAVTARRFDTHSNPSRPIHTEANEDDVRPSGETEAAPMPLAEPGLHNRHNGTPRSPHPTDGVCEVDDVAGLDNPLAEAQRKTISRQRLPKRWQVTVVTMLALGFLATVGYRLSVTAFGGGLANRIPSLWIHAASEKTLAVLDRDWLLPSHLDGERQAELRNRFAALRAPIEGAPPYRLLFRQGKRVGARTFSLPDGDIVITDEMVALARDNRQVIALLAYELGHLHYKHALMHAVDNTTFVTTLAGYLSDTTTGTTTLSDGLLQVSYAFDDEHQADTYAASMLRTNGLPPGVLIDVLVRQLQSINNPAGKIPPILAAKHSLPERLEALRNGI